MRRTSRARAPMQRRMPISRVRSSTFMMMAFASPTMLMATIRNPSRAIEVVIVPFAHVGDLAGDVVAEGREAILEQRGGSVDQRMLRGARTDPVGAGAGRLAEHRAQGGERDEQHGPVFLLVRSDADDPQLGRPAR